MGWLQSIYYWVFGHLIFNKKLRQIPNIKLQRSRSMVLGCLSIQPLTDGTEKILYRGRDLFFGGYHVSSTTKGRLFHIIGEIGLDGLDFMIEKGYRFALQGVNTDIITQSNRVIARCGPDELSKFMQYHRLTLQQKKDRLLLEKIVKEDSIYRYDPEETYKLLGDRIPPSGRPNGHGLAPDFDGFTDYLFNNDPAFGRVKFQMTGSRKIDQRLLNEHFGLTDEILDEKGFVWHHLDDVYFNEAGEMACTMQLISKVAHNQVRMRGPRMIELPLGDIIKAGDHVGSVAIWRAFYGGITYK